MHAILRDNSTSDKPPQNDRMMANIMFIQKEFKRNGFEDRLLKAGGSKPVLPCLTRQRNVAISYLKNLWTMNILVTASDAVTKEGDTFVHF